MSNLARILSIGGALVALAGYGLNSPRAEGPSHFEVTVSPAADLDPRDETAIAVVAKNDHVIVGASKVISGGGTAGRADNLVANYFSSDEGRSWGSGLISLFASKALLDAEMCRIRSFLLGDGNRV